MIRAPNCLFTLTNSNMNPTTPLLPSPPTYSPHSSLSGITYMFISCVFFGSSTFLIHYTVSTTVVSSFNIVFLRACFELPFSLLLLILRPPVQHKLSSLLPHLPLLLLRGLLGALTILFVYLSLYHLPVADCMTIFFFNPISTLFIAHFLISEHMGFLDLLASIVSFVGIVLISHHPSSIPESLSQTSNHALGVTLALTAALCCSLGFVSARSLGSDVHFLTTVAAVALPALVLSVICGGALNPFMVPGKGGLLGLLAGALGVGGQCFLSVGLQNCRAGAGAMIRNLDVPLAYAFGIIGMGETATLGGIIGAVLVVTGTGIVGIRQMIATK